MTQLACDLAEAKRLQTEIDWVVALIATTDAGSGGLVAVRKGLDKATVPATP